MSQNPPVPAVPSASSAHIGQAVRQWLGRYISPNDPRHLDTLTLWALHTHYFPEVLYTSPRLLIHSPLPGSGKSTVIQHLERLCRNGMEFSSITGPAVMVRAIQIEPTTLLIDEIDKSLRAGKQNVEDLYAVINSGYKKGAQRPLLVPDGRGGWGVQRQPTAAPLALAGLPTDIPADTMSRTIQILMLPGQDVEETDWERLDSQIEPLAKHVREWAERTRLPDDDCDWLKGRERERWRPLFRVALALGHDWPERVKALVEEERERMRLEAETGITEVAAPLALLRDVQEQWPTHQEIWSASAIAERLRAGLPDRWGTSEQYPKGLTTQRVGRYLSKFGLMTKRQSDGGRAYFYARTDLDRVTARLGLRAENPLEELEIPDDVAGMLRAMTKEAIREQR